MLHAPEEVRGGELRVVEQRVSRLTAPAGMSASSSAFSKSPVVQFATNSETMLYNSSIDSLRVAASVTRGSSSISGRSIKPKKLRQWRVV